MPRPRPPLKPIINVGKKLLPIICPNPNVSLTLPPKITFSCR